MTSLLGLRRFAVAALVLASSALPSAKGPTVRLVISGHGLLRPIEITEARALANVWAGRFIGEQADEPDARLPRSRIDFYVLPPREKEPRLMYAVTYVYDPASGGGFLYLPGRGDDGWALNVRTILRDSQDGRWHTAEPDWSESIEAALQH